MRILNRLPKAEVLSHWYLLVPSFRTSTNGFYSGVEAQLQDLEIPGLQTSRVEFAEGGMLSAKREYLRLRRERLVFDVCAAPFGTSYFFSMRFAELPAVINPLAIAVVLFAFGMGATLVWKAFGIFTGIFLLLVVLAVLIYLLRNLVALGLQDVDATLIKFPLVGPVYEALFRRETYFREDTRLMYLESVDAIVKAQVEEVTSAKGVKLLSIKHRSSLLDELYRSRPLADPGMSHEQPG